MSSYRTLLSTFKKMVSNYLELAPGVRMPIVGFGTWQATDAELEDAMEKALEAGYRHIDTAYVYENEHVIGRVLNRWLTSGRVDRKDLFIVTKLPACGNRPSTVEKYMKRSLKNLQLDYVDQYLVHTPLTFVEVEGNNHPTNDKGAALLEPTTDHVAVWKEMEKQVDAGRTLSIGLSNFNEKQMETVLNTARIKPISLQIEIHLYFQQKPLVEFCKKHGIFVTAYSPLGSRGIETFLTKMGCGKKIPDLLDNSTVKSIASKHGKTPAQVLLRYIIQKGIAVIPKSTNPERLRQNISVFDFSLDEVDCGRLQAEDKGPDARVCNFDFMKGVRAHPQYPF